LVNQNGKITHQREQDEELSWTRRGVDTGSGIKHWFIHINLEGRDGAIMGYTEGEEEKNGGMEEMGGKVIWGQNSE